MIKNNHVFIFSSLLLSAVCCLLVLFLPSCGKKGDPTLKSYEKPEAPVSLKAIHRESEIILSWEFPRSKEQGIRGFHLMKSSDGDYQRISFVQRDIRAYRDTDFVVGQEYRYKIISENLIGITNDSPILNVKPLHPPPPPPGKIRFKATHETITITWEKSNETSFYNIYKSTEKGQYSLTPLNSQPLKETSFQDSFDINSIVFYTVRSSTGNAIQDEGPSSEDLMVNPLDFTPSSPRDLMAVPTSDSVYLIWKEPPETWVTGYKVYRETGKQEGYIFIGFTYTPSFVDRDKVADKKNYRVTAIGPSKEGSPAEIRDVLYETPR